MTLEEITTFDALVTYLRNELDWPIEKADFDELTFDYSPEELGIDSASAAKIQELKRLRPLSPGQPWGIFFVKFEDKRLPVVALRRILSRVALKKRASSNSADWAAWRMDNLLFISNYGEEAHRQISFAHFSKSESHVGLPVLKVLGWDSLDTPLHLSHVRGLLSDYLSWPDDEGDTDAWRSQWQKAFTLRHREVISTSRSLAERLAVLAKAIRYRIVTVLEVETPSGPISKLKTAFREGLVHDLDDEGFADMYAQTIAYGLLSARIVDPSSGSAENFTQHLKASPFLNELMETFLKVGNRSPSVSSDSEIDFDELGISDVIALLDAANMEAVVRDFGNRNPEEDPVIHFYELFLKEYDAKKRMQRGVFYTPRPVVSYMVELADSNIRERFGLVDGLADVSTWADVVSMNPNLKPPKDVSPEDPFVTILDPATGTGTFLVEAIDLVYRTLVTRWQGEGSTRTEIDGLWNDYVPKHLLPRLFGYELLTAPYAIAHLKISLKLRETGYRFSTDERVRVYLTNALEPGRDMPAQLSFDVPALAHEAAQVNRVKRSQIFTVVIGNPPYSDASQNLGEQFAPLIERFRHYDGNRIREKGAIRFEHVINNDYVKFWGLVLQLLDRAIVGDACLITSSSFLEGKSFRGVREGMLEAVGEITITDLHGEGWAGAMAQAGVQDENVFEIQTGVAVTQLHRRIDHDREWNVSYKDLAGSYSQKVAALGGKAAQKIPVPVLPDRRRYLSFVPASGSGNDEYWEFDQVDSFFQSSVDGIKTSRDALVIGNSADSCFNTIRQFADSGDLSDSEIEREFKFKKGKLDLEKVRVHVSSTLSESNVHRIAYRPMDLRYIYYDRELILSHRMNLMPEILDEKAWSLVFASRLSTKGFDHVVATDTLCTNKYSSHDINSRLFPVVRLSGPLEGNELVSNIKPDILDRARVPTDMTESDRASVFGHYLYGITNAPSYRTRYREEISQDFPRVPLPASAAFLEEIAGMGRQLVDLHCLKIPVPEGAFPFVGQAGDEISAPSWKADTLKVGNSSMFSGVGEDIWRFRMAGYQLCKSWFSAGGKVNLDRKGLVLDGPKIEEIARMLWAIKETLRIREGIDAAIASQGDWQGAFQRP